VGYLENKELKRKQRKGFSLLRESAVFRKRVIA